MKRVTIFLLFYVILFSTKVEAMPLNEDEVNKQAYDLINVQKMWDAGFTGEGVNIAILDNGIGNANRLHSEFNQNKITRLLDCTLYFSFSCEETDYDDMHRSHGTSVAGLIGAKHNGVGMKGIAPGTKIIPFKITEELNGAPYSFLLKALNGIYEYNDNQTNDTDKIHIINMSFEIKLSSERVEEALRKLYDQGVLIVGAGGNSDGSVNVIDDKISFPAYLDYVIGVANVTESGDRYVGGTPKEGVTSESGSLVGSGLDIAAPGVNLWSTITDYGKTEGEDYYQLNVGTSFSAPIVSGYLALLKEQFPNDTAEELRRKLFINTVPRPGLTSNDSTIQGNLEYGNGILQAVPYGVKSTVTVTSNTEFYKIPHVDYLSTYKVSRDTEMKVYLKWKNPVDSTDTWLKLQNNLWIKASIAQKMGEPIEARDILVNEQTKAYAFPWEDAENIDLSEHIIPGVYSSSRGYIELGTSIHNIKVSKNYLWYQIQVGEHFMWVKEKPILKLKNIQYMTFQKNDLVYDQPSFSSPSHTVSELGNPKGVTKYSYDGYDYNENEKRFNWYSFSTSNGLKWYPSVYDQYNAEKLPESNGFEDGVIRNWNDYINSDFIQTWKKEMMTSPTWSAQFEEQNLFTENDFNEVYESYKHYKYHTVSTLTHLQYGDRAVRLFFSNSPMRIDNTSSTFPYYKTIDGSEFIMIYPSKSTNGEKRYLVSKTKSSLAGSSVPTKFDIKLYELNLD